MNFLGIGNKSTPSGRSRFGLLHHIKADQAVGTQPPEKMNVHVMHPENAPQTIPDASAYPQNFAQYEYAGSTLEKVQVGQTAEGTPVYRRALVARMVGTTEVGGAKFTEEMTVSLADLRSYKDPATGKIGHPMAEKIGEALTKDYQTKIHPSQQEAPRHQPTLAQQATASQKAPSTGHAASTGFTKTGSSSFFHKMNTGLKV